MLLRLFSSCNELGLLWRCGAGLLIAQASSCGGALALGHVGFSSCGSQVPERRLMVVVHRLSCPGTWDFPGLGIKPVSPALAGGFFTSEPPGKSAHEAFNCYFG